MPVDVTEASFEREVVERSRQVPVVVDFWAEWCGPCRTLSPALEAAETARRGKVVLAKVDVDANQALAARYGVQGIPAVKAFRDGEVVGEFVGAVPRSQVEQLFDSLAPSRADELFEKGDEVSLREAADLEPRRADIAVALAKARLERGAEDEALEAVKAHEEDFAAAGIAGRIRLAGEGIGVEAWDALDRGDRDTALELLLAEIPTAGKDVGGSPADQEVAGADAGKEIREDLRRVIVGILSELDPADPVARDYRKRLAAALY